VVEFARVVLGRYGFVFHSLIKYVKYVEKIWVEICQFCRKKGFRRKLLN